jgi:hypothetical protein
LIVTENHALGEAAGKWQQKTPPPGGKRRFRIRGI